MTLRTKNRFIVKVQRPVHTTSKNRPWMFYDRERKFWQTFPERQVPVEIVSWFREVETFKAYFEASIDKDGKLLLDFPVAWKNENHGILQGFESDLWHGEEEWETAGKGLLVEARGGKG